VEITGIFDQIGYSLVGGEWQEGDFQPGFLASQSPEVVQETGGLPFRSHKLKWIGVVFKHHLQAIHGWGGGGGGRCK
jgi:hypothetical protein